MNYNTENARIIIDKYVYEDYSKKEEFLKQVSERLSLELSNRIMNVLDSQEEVVMKKPKVETQNNYITCQVETTKKVEWMPLVRCEDCMECVKVKRETANYLPFLLCRLNQRTVSGDEFCCWGRREE